MTVKEVIKYIKKFEKDHMYKIHVLSNRTVDNKRFYNNNPTFDGKKFYKVWGQVVCAKNIHKELNKNVLDYQTVKGEHLDMSIFPDIATMKHHNIYYIWIDEVNKDNIDSVYTKYDKYVEYTNEDLEGLIERNK